MNLNVWADFQICISVPLSIGYEHFHFRLFVFSQVKLYQNLLTQSFFSILYDQLRIFNPISGRRAFWPAAYFDSK